MPVCVNCGGGDFVWADSLHTGGLGRRTLSLRARGDLPLGTRVCRGCGHADLFLKDVSVLKELSPGTTGDFQPLPAALSGAPSSGSSRTSDSLPPSVADASDRTPAVPWSEGAEPSPPEVKKPPRRRGPAKGKTTGPPLILD